MSLPPPDRLERICKGIATLDAILSEEWECRYFAFNCAWNEAKNERMASMRSGAGDEWFLVFSGERAFVKVFSRQAVRQDPSVVYAGLPPELEPQRVEPAFSSDVVSYGGWYDADTGWTLRGDASPMLEELAILSGDAEAYRTYAAEYFEVEVPLDMIAHVLAGAPLEPAIVTGLAGDRSLESLHEDLREIGY